MTVPDVAAAVLEGLGRPTGAAALEKLIDYVQAWHLVDFDEPAFDDEIEAWPDGPLVRALSAIHRGADVVEDGCPGSAGHLGQGVQQTVDWVVATYGPLSAGTLSRMTCAEAPWIVARAGRADCDRSSGPIPQSVMRAYYGNQRAPARDVVGVMSASAALEGRHVDADWRVLLRDVADGR